MEEQWSGHRLAEELMRVLPLLGRAMAQFMREAGEEESTMMQLGVLYQIQQQSMTASEIAKRRRVSLQAVSVLVQGLVERGWIIRVPDSKDRRQYLLQITPEGSEHAQTTLKQISVYLDSFLSEMTDEEIAAAQIFLPALNKLLSVQTEAKDTETIETQEALLKE